MSEAQRRRQEYRDKIGRYAHGAGAGAEVTLRGIDPWGWDAPTEEPAVAEPAVDVPTTPWGHPLPAPEPPEDSDTDSNGEDPGPAQGPVREGADMERVRRQVCQAFGESASPVMPVDQASLQAQRELTKRFGSPDQAVVAVGEVLSRRADQLAGFDPEMVERDREQDTADAYERMDEVFSARTVVSDGYSHEAQQHVQKIRALHQERETAATEQDKRRVLQEIAEHEARFADLRNTYVDQMTALRIEENALRRVMRGAPGPRGTKTLDRLAQAHRQVLAETRSIGEEDMQWRIKTSRAARDVFDRAASDYPSQWVSRSNAVEPPLAKIQKSRAHYADTRIQVTRRRQEVSRTLKLSPAEDFSARVQKMRERSDIRVTDVDLKNRQVEFTPMELHRGQTRPQGSGWQTRPGWGDDLWMRPRTELRVNGVDHYPEITTNPEADPTSDDPLATRPSQRIATHELGHRFEATVPGIKAMEVAYVARRKAENRQQWKTRAGKRSSGGRRPEVFAETGMAVPYMSRVYEDGSREVLSCGTEALLHGRYGGLVGVEKDYEADQESRSFTLGVLACADTRHDTRRPHPNRS